MQKRFKPLLAAAVAAGAIPLLENVSPVGAATITAAGFVFDSYTVTAATAGSVSFTADTFSPGYGGGLTATLTNTTAQGWVFVNGNGSAKGFNGQGWGSSGYYGFGFNIDDLNTMIIRFDMRSTNTGPAQFALQTSLDGSIFNNITTITVTGTTAVWSTGTSQTAFAQSFALPAGFSDTAVGSPGQSGFIRLVGLTALNLTGGTVANGGTNSIDNIFITGQQVPEPTSMIMTLAAAAGLSLRPKRRD